MPLSPRSLGRSVFLLLLLCTRVLAQEPPLRLADLMDEARKNNPEILAAQARARAALERIPQAGALPDPMLSVGYENEGFKKYTYGESPDAKWMFGASQTFPFPGKRPLRQETSTFEARSADASARAVRLKVFSGLGEAYYDLFLVYKDLDLISERRPLIEKIEKVALSRYASGTGSLEEAIMAQTQRYMLAEKQEMATWKKEVLESTVNRYVGRQADSPLARPVELPPTPYGPSREELIASAPERSPDLLALKNDITASEKRLQTARKEAWPDLTLGATYTDRSSAYEDMWALSASFTLPLFYNRKQKAMASEASWNLDTARQEFEASRVAVSSDIRGNYAMMLSAGRLMDLYQNGLIPKARQDIDAAMARYAAGKLDANAVLAKLASSFEYELQYWQQYVEREKAITRLNAVSGIMEKEEAP